MKLFGSLSEIVGLVFRKNSQAITLRPNQAVTYTASRDIQTPAQDTASILVSRDSTDTLTNKSLTSPAITTPTGIVKGDVGLGNVDNTSDATKNAASVTLTNKSISGATNTLTAIPAGSALSGQVPTANGGTGQNSTATFPTSGVVVTEAASETLTNKTISGSSNTLTVLAGSQLSGQVPTANGGTGQNSTATFPTSGVVVTEAATETLTNKTLTSPTINTPTISTSTVTTSESFSNQAAAKFFEQTGNGTNFIALTAPDAVTTDTTMKLPDGAGSSGQFLQTNGTNAMTWATPTASTAVAGNVNAATSTDQTLVNGDNSIQTYAPTAAHAVILPTTSVVAGRVFTIYNKTSAVFASQFRITIKASGGQVLNIANSCNMTGIIGNGYITVQALQATPTTAAHWRILDIFEEGNYSGYLVNDDGGNLSSANTGSAASNAGLNIVRKGNIVHVAGVLDINISSGSTYNFRIDCPISPSFTSSRQAGGSGAGVDTATFSVTLGMNMHSVSAVSGGNQVRFKGISTTTGASGCATNFQYWIQA